MNRSFRLTMPGGDGPVWKKVIASGWRAVAMYVGMGLVLSLVLRAIVGPGVWRGFDGEPDFMFGMTVWGLFWPLMLLLMMVSH